MSDQYVQVGLDGAGKKIDTEELTVGANTVERQRIVVMNGFVPASFDYMSYTNTSSTVDTYTYKLGGSGGTTVRTVTVTWTNSTKSILSSIAST